jgi:chaperonin GroEL (HSP60 family)
MKNLTAGKNPILLKIGMKKALQFLISNINEYSRPVENLLAISQVAKISVGNDFEKVFISQYFITNPERIEAILESSYILDSR